MDAQCHRKATGTGTFAAPGLRLRQAPLSGSPFGTARAQARFADVDVPHGSSAMDGVGAQLR